MLFKKATKGAYIASTCPEVAVCNECVLFGLNTPVPDAHRAGHEVTVNMLLGCKGKLSVISIFTFK